VLRRLVRGTGVPLLRQTGVMIGKWIEANPQWGPESVNLAVKSCQSFYGWAVRQELIQVDPSRHLDTAKVPCGLPQPIPEPVLAEALPGRTGRAG
jgi:site-specific recombinase XerD